MKIHQAYFGDDNDSHNLLTTSINDASLIGELKSITDAPITPEQPYISGFRINYHYIFCRTIADTTAKRKGMVFSHCIIIPIEQLSNLDDLTTIFKHFLESPLKDFKGNLPQIQIKENTSLNIQKPQIYDTLVYRLINSNKTIVFIGYNEFESAIKYLWYHLPFSIRKEFTFTLSGSPNELLYNDYTLVHSPEKCLNKWDDYTIIKQPIPSNDLNFTNYLSDDIDLQEFNEFISKNNIQLKRLNQFSDLYKCFSLIQECELTPSLKTIRRLVSLLAKLFPNPKTAQKLKPEVINKLGLCLRQSKTSEIIIFRNLKFEAFENGLEQVKYVSKNWLAKNFTHNSSLEVSTITEVLNSCFQQEKIKWLEEVIREWLNDIFSNLDSLNARFLWSVTEHETNLLELFFSYISIQNEPAFVKNFPKDFNKEWYKNVSSQALAGKHFSIFAISNINLHPLQKSINLQLTNDETKSLKDNLILISQHVKDIEFISTAAKFSNSTLHEYASEICVKDSKLFSNMDVTNINWQSIWLMSHKFTKDITKGISNIQEKYFKLLDLLIFGEKINTKLFNLLSKEIAHIFNYPDRQKAWDYIPPLSKIPLLEGTSQYIFDNSKYVSWDSIEEDLLDCIKDDNFIIDIVAKSEEKSIKYKLTFLKKSGSLTEENATKTLKEQERIKYSDVSFLVELINQNEWKKFLDYIYDHKERYNYKYVIGRCKSLLTPWRRFFFTHDTKYHDKQDVIDLIEEGKLDKVFKILNKIGHHESLYYSMREEFIAGNKGIDEINLGRRLITYIDTLYTEE